MCRGGPTCRGRGRPLCHKDVNRQQHCRLKTKAFAIEPFAQKPVQQFDLLPFIAALDRQPKKLAGQPVSPEAQPAGGVADEG